MMIPELTPSQVKVKLGIRGNKENKSKIPALTGRTTIAYGFKR